MIFVRFLKNKYLNYWPLFLDHLSAHHLSLVKYELWSYYPILDAVQNLRFFRFLLGCV